MVGSAAGPRPNRQADTSKSAAVVVLCTQYAYTSICYFYSLWSSCGRKVQHLDEAGCLRGTDILQASGLRRLDRHRARPPCVSHHQSV